MHRTFSKVLKIFKNILLSQVGGAATNCCKKWSGGAHAAMRVRKLTAGLHDVWRSVHISSDLQLGHSGQMRWDEWYERSLV